MLIVLQLEKALPLPSQTMGNCSFLSPVTAIYTLALLMNVRSEKEGLLIDVLPEEGILLNE
jgi:hypothetical protein